MVSARRRASARLPSHHIDGIDQAVAQLRGLLGVLSSVSVSRTEVSLWPEDLANLIWLIQDQLEILDTHAQALWALAQPHSPKKAIR
jgi:hypothetical protein